LPKAFLLINAAAPEDGRTPVARNGGEPKKSPKPVDFKAFFANFTPPFDQDLR